MTDYSIRIIVDPSGASRGVQQVERGLDRARASAAGLGSAMRSALAIAGLGFGVQQIIQLADAYTEMRNAVRLAVGANGDLQGTMDRLFDTANATLTPVDAMVSLYRRGAQSARELGASQEELFTLTTVVGQALAVQGTSAAKAQGTLLQLAQALGSGTVRAEEFNSINEGASRILQAAADGMDGMGGSVSRLRNEVIAGRVSSQEFFDALLSQAPQLAEEFATAVPTIGSAFTVLRNNLVRAFGEFNQATGASEGLARAILFVGQHAHALVDVAEALAYAVGVKFAVEAVQAAIRGLAALGAAIVRNPIGALATGITYAAAAMVAFSDRVKLSSDSSASAFDFIAVAFGDLAGLIGDGVQNFIGLFGDFEDELGGFDFGKFVRAIARGVDAVTAFLVGMYRGTVQLFTQLPRIIAEKMIDGLNGALRAGTSFVNDLIEALNRIPGVAIEAISAPQVLNGYEGAGASVGEAYARGFRETYEAGVAQAWTEGAFDRAEERAREAAQRAARTGDAGPTPPGASPEDADGRRGRDPLTFQRVLDQLAEEARLLGMVSREREVHSRLLQAEEDLRRDGVELSEAQRRQLEGVLRQNQAYADQAALLDELRGPQDELVARQAALAALYAQGQVSASAFNQELRGIQVSMAELRIQAGDGTFADAVITVLDRLTEKARNVTQSLRDDFGDFFQSLTDGFADSVGRAIVYSEDLGSAIQEVARSALAELISALVKLGIQWVINSTLGQAIASQQTAASAALAAATASAWAPAAAAVSLASYGANSPAAIAGMAAAYAASSALSAVPGMRDGGLVMGPGSSTSDDVLRRLSAGEFVVSADAARRNLALLQGINSGAAPSAAALAGDVINNNHFSPTLNVHMDGDADRSSGQRRAEDVRRALMPELEKMFGAYIDTQQRYRGRLSNPRGQIG